MDRHNRAVFAKVDAETREWVKKFRIIRCTEEKQPILFSILSLMIEESGLRIYTSPDHPNTFFCKGPNVCFGDIPHMYAGWYQRAYCESKGLKTLDAEYWKDPARSLGLYEETDYERPSDFPFRIAMLDEYALRKLGFSIPDDFKYLPGEEPYIRGRTKWLRIYGNRTYRDNLIDAIEAVVGRDSVYMTPANESFHLPNSYFVEIVYEDLQEHILDEFRDIWENDLGKPEASFLAETGLHFFEREYKRIVHKWNQPADYFDLRHLRRIIRIRD